ncbi:MAG: hypothetical protein AAFX06_20720 [Planctomycetota bacterium]
MHRITLGLLILMFGAVIALPFRKPTKESESDSSNSTEPLADLDLMVLEVTENVQAPVLFQAQEDEHRLPSTEPASYPQPLTYEDLAVPLEGDVVFESKFNAVSEVVARKQEREGDRLSQLERMFAEKGFSAVSSSEQAAPSATLTSASSSNIVRPNERAAGQEHVSVLEPLPPGGDRTSEVPAQKHWIQQPD